jgi:general secretion pathway protein G
MMHKTKKNESGFTLFELLIVMSIVAILMAMSVPYFRGAIVHAREAVLKEDLAVMRAAIDSYTMDKQKGPGSLEDLVNEGYLRSIPNDPMTQSNSTWSTEQADALHSLDQTDPGIADVHSGSDEQGSDGQPYNAW